ncbi:syntaxin-81, partial [Tanacetum coccineum]
MAKVRDRIEDFKDAVNRGALSLGFNEAKRAALMASFIIHKPRERSNFTKAALKTLESIGTLEKFLIEHRKDYIDPHRTTEEERDSIEHEVSIFVKACKEQIDILRTSITNEEVNSKGWLGSIRGDNANADTIAHKHGVVLILSEKLHSVTSQFDQLRAVRFQEAINRAMPRRKPKRAPEKTSTDISYSSNSLDSREPTSSETRDHGEILAEPMKVQQQ